MKKQLSSGFLSFVSLSCLLLGAASFAAEGDEYFSEESSSSSSTTTTEESSSGSQNIPRLRPSTRKKVQTKSRYYLSRDPRESRSDAGVFHVGFAVGGNVYIEPEVNTTTKVPTGDYFRDFGFQGGVYFDYDYSEVQENIPLMLRGMVGYKYILSGTHVFSFDGVVRRQFRFSERSSFGIGGGGSAAVWYRSLSNVSDEQIIFLPSLITTAGFEFDPFMVDFKWLINEWGGSGTRMGFELYFGFRL